MSEGFAQAMAARSDAELLEIANAGEGTWREEALMAAHSELERRGMTLPSREEAEKSRAAINEARAEVPLEPVWILMAFGGSLLIFPWLIMANNFERNGYLRKARTLRAVTLLVPALYVISIVIAVLAHRLSR
jgi:hypothetical protein